jgi:AAA+ superfamily predicted ATPase
VTLNKTSALQDYLGDIFPRVFKDEPIRVVVDQNTFWQKQGTPGPLHDDPSEEYGFPEGEEHLEDSDGNALERALVCCYPEVGVFSLRDKEWASVRVDDLRPVSFREKAFKRLVIKEEYKRMMIAMVEAYMLEQPGFSDIVTGKGRGLIILLHGPPGVGKTLAAECIAERQQRPLYSVSCGDLGTEPEDLERRLKEVFSYAVLWKAILLMDEADIFLQERDMHDVKRNALVSIFLRELEYFDGILFLTTNRPGDIDEAFQSRIHISMGLKALNVEERRQVWAVFIRDLSLSDKEKRSLLEYVTQQFDADKLNGRQIRNAVRSGLALAQLRGEKLLPEHLERVVRIGREFRVYIEDLNQMNAEEYAIALGRRAPVR